MNWFMEMLTKIESIFDKAAPVLESAAKITAQVSPAFGPEGMAISAGAGLAGTLITGLETVSQQHEQAVSSGTPETEQAITTAAAVTQLVANSGLVKGQTMQNVSAILATIKPGPQG